MTYALRSFLIICLPGLLLSGCSWIQSVLAPIGDRSGAVSQLSWIIFIGGGVILTGVMALTAYAISANPQRRQWLSSNRLVVGGGIVFPIVTLSILLIYGLVLTGASGRIGERAPLRIEITGEQFWWRVAYLDADGGSGFEMANEINIPVGRPVEVTLKSADVIHSFWLPKLGGKLDMIPGQTNRLVLQAEEPGFARGQCTEYCGIQHAKMAFYANALPVSEYEQWESREAGPAVEPETDKSRQGQQLFISAGCGACHSIRGTAATGRIGPDLTHLGSRHSIGAGLLQNNADNIASWISASQHLKPGNRMPSFEALESEQLKAIADYLENLK